MVRLAATSLLLLSLATPLHASDPGSPEPGRLSFSVTAGVAKSPDLFNGTLGGSLAGQASIGLDVTRGLTVEARAGYCDLGGAGVFTPVTAAGTGSGGGRGIHAMIPLTAGLICRLPMATAVRPYLATGAGAYLLHMPNDASHPTTRFGLNLGCGMLIPSGRISGVLDLRYHDRLGREPEPDIHMVTAMVGVEIR